LLRAESKLGRADRAFPRRRSFDGRASRLPEHGSDDTAPIDSPASVAHDARDQSHVVDVCTTATGSDGDESSRWFWDHYVDAAGEVISFLEADAISLAGKRVGDVGCGDGIIDLGVAHRARPTLLVGFDIKRDGRRPTEGDGRTRGR
jgi:2-polyprenyl-3-methyl-5-hydroxy-6-metoxy-1,4-benzoquinol methylase